MAIAAQCISRRKFVAHFMRRHDGALPTTTAYATIPIVLADGNLRAPEGLDRERGIQFLIQDELRAVILVRRHQRGPPGEVFLDGCAVGRERSEDQGRTSRHDSSACARSPN
jgi:hypothetical protein